MNSGDGFGPGMVSGRRCVECGMLLGVNDTVRCVECSGLLLSALAQAVGAKKRQMLDAHAAFEREVRQLEILVRQVEKAVDHVDERYGRHSGKVARGVEAGG